MRVITAALLGAIVMFAWGYAAHMITIPQFGSSLGMVGINTLPDETATIDQLKSSVPREGFYMFPSTGAEGPGRKTGASGVLVFHPDGEHGMTPEKLATEFGSTFVQLLIAGILLLAASLSMYIARVGFITLMGIGSALAANVAYWNWYGFPLDYTLSFAGIHAAGFFLAGIFMAAMLAPRTKQVTDDSTAIGEMRDASQHSSLAPAIDNEYSGQSHMHADDHADDHGHTHDHDHGQEPHRH